MADVIMSGCYNPYHSNRYQVLAGPPSKKTGVLSAVIEAINQEIKKILLVLKYKEAKLIR